MNPNSPYFKQVQLLVNALPVVAKQACFALKGGTAINLFVRDLPRLSVDIDLAFLPVKERDESLAEIQQAMQAIRAELTQRLGLRVSITTLQDSGTITRLVVSDGSSQIKIEVTPVLRGAVNPASLRTVMPGVEQAFGFAEIQMLDFNDLYAGKLCAALDRQHPRDLFDVQLLLANEGISEALKNTFLVYLISHGRPMAELLTSRPKPLAEVFNAEFFGMTTTPVTVECRSS